MSGSFPVLDSGGVPRPGWAPLLVRAQALSGALPPEAVIGRRTAAWVWGLDVLPPGTAPEDWPVEVLAPRGRLPSPSRGMRAFATALPPEDVTVHRSVRVTTLERTALDCARWLPRLEAVAALDQFLRKDVDPTVLADRASLLTGRPHVEHLREVLAVGDRGAQSPGESRARTLIIDAGLPHPTTQIPEEGPNGRTLRIDLGDPTRKVGVEYDGEEHHTTPDATARDRLRAAWLHDRGWKLIRITKVDVLLEPRPFLADYLDALRTRGWTPDEDHLCAVLARITLDPRRRPRPTSRERPSRPW